VRNARTTRPRQRGFNDATGNLTSRTQIVNGVTLSESFTYDQLNRLMNHSGSGSDVDVTYDTIKMERMASKTDAGAEYDYNSAKPYELAAIHDPSATITSLPDQSITYTSFNKIKTISQGGYVITFWYGPDKQRCKMEVKLNGTEEYTRYYFGNYEIVEKNGNVLEEIFYLSSPSGVIGFNRIKTTPAEDNIYYTLKDYLGSILVVTNEVGTSKLEEYSYDAWGRRRNPTNWTYTSVPAPTYLSRGYTGHEHIEEAGLINMNGRVYDPLVGMFLSPDPVVQSPGDPLNYNRYSYVFNNPLKYIDPSGYSAALLRYAEADHNRRTADDNKSASSGGGGWNPFTSWYFKGSFSMSSANWAGVGTERGLPYVYRNGRYYNAQGDQVSYQEVHNNYILPNASATYGYVPKDNAGEIVNKIYNGTRSNPLDRLVGYHITGEDGHLKYVSVWDYNRLVRYNYKAANGGGPQRELVATGVVTSIMLFAGGGVGIEAGTIKYKGEEYGIVSVAVGGGLDISGGWNFIKIYADPNNFDIYDLEGAGGHGNASFTIIGGSWEAPSSGEQFTDQYRIKSWGWEVGPPIFWGGGSWTHTTTKIIPPGKNPTLYDLYKTRPGGY